MQQKKRWMPYGPIMKASELACTSPRIIPIFLPYQGCRQRCIFCNETITTGNPPTLCSPSDFEETVALYSRERKPGPGSPPVQLAFYGGTFTGMAKERQARLLQMARPLIQEGRVDSVRISTRPDEIDEDVLDFLYLQGVRTVEIGVQSLVGKVLLSSRRGHTVEDVFTAVEKLRKRRFEVGLHLMIGLPGDEPQFFAATIDRTLELQPDSVRLHPTLVFRNTVLADLYFQGRYSPLSISEAVHQSQYAALRLEKAGIPIIRLGLQSTAEMELPGNIIAGPYHPAFRSLVDAAIFRDMASALLSRTAPESRSATFILSPRDLSNFRGQKSENLPFLYERFQLKEIRITGDSDYPRGWLALRNGDRTVSMHRTGLRPFLS